MALLFGIAKWLSLTATALLGIAGLFFGSYHEDPVTKRRKPTRAGWIILGLLCVTFLTSIATTVVESQRAAQVAAQSATQATFQQQQIAALRTVILGQREFHSLKIQLVFLPKVFAALATRHPIIKDHLAEDLRYEDKEVWYTPQGQDVNPQVTEDFRPGTVEYGDFVSFLTDLLSQRLIILLNEDIQVGGFMSGTSLPSRIEVGDHDITLEFSPKGLRLSDFEHAQFRVLIDLDNPSIAPTQIVLISDDPNLTFGASPLFVWTRSSRTEEDGWRAPVAIPFLESKPVDVPTVFPHAFDQFHK